MLRDDNSAKQHREVQVRKYSEDTMKARATAAKIGLASQQSVHHHDTKFLRLVNPRFSISIPRPLPRLMQVTLRTPPLEFSTTSVIIIRSYNNRLFLVNVTFK